MPRCLGSALVAVGLLLVVLATFDLYAHRMERRSIHALAPEALEQKNQGRALQAEAFRQPDLLPLYGTSELRAYQGPFHPSELFRTYPTGFTVFPVGKEGATALTILQDLAAVGSDLRGKKVAVSLSLSWFDRGDTVRHDTYAGNFSRLHANELAFSTDLSFPLKQSAARRLLLNPATLEADPLLRFVLERLADGSPPSDGLFYAVLPLGKLACVVLRLQDHWETLALIAGRADTAPGMPRQPATLDWPSLLARAGQDARAGASNNSLGFDNQVWNNHPELRGRGHSTTDQALIPAVQHGVWWDDLDLLLRALKELDAQPLILSAPIKGAYYDFRGISRQARAAYYERVRGMVSAYGATLADFADHDQDTLFLLDPAAHPSAEGWAYYDQALDAFYHGVLP